MDNYKEEQELLNDLITAQDMEVRTIDRKESPEAWDEYQAQRKRLDLLKSIQDIFYRYIDLED